MKIPDFFINIINNNEKEGKYIARKKSLVSGCNLSSDDQRNKTKDERGVFLRDRQKQYDNEKHLKDKNETNYGIDLMNLELQRDETQGREYYEDQRFGVRMETL